jgi:hypothetical protein
VTSGIRPHETRVDWTAGLNNVTSLEAHGTAYRCIGGRRNSRRMRRLAYPLSSVPFRVRAILPESRRWIKRLPDNEFGHSGD